jgi:ribosome maturation factor RimP
MRQPLIDKIQEIADRVTRSEDIELVEIRLLGGGKNRILRITIDKPEGVGHADCELVSQQVGTILDVEDVIPGRHYTLEVTSPGIERKLTRPEHFARFTGKKVKLVCREPVDNSKYWEGALTGFSGGIVTLDAGKGRVLRIQYDNIEKANLKFEW